VNNPPVGLVDAKTDAAEGKKTYAYDPHLDQTPDEMYFGTGDAVPAALTSRAAAARRTRVEAILQRGVLIAAACLALCAVSALSAQQKNEKDVPSSPPRGTRTLTLSAIDVYLAVASVDC
jgi:hypothetical protein